MSPSILVVGGGIAGRAVARGLAQHDLECTVVERRDSVSRGMGVNLPGNAVRALGELGVPTEALARGVRVRRREYRNGGGRLLFAVDDARFWREVAPPVCLRHGDLLEALPLPGGTTLEHARATTARPTPAGVEVEVEVDGIRRPRLFDFVIGADGVHSTMRQAIADDTLRPSAMTGSSWRFVTDNPGVDCWTAWSGQSETFLLIPVEQDRVYGYAARTRGGHTGSDPTWMTQASEGFPKVVRTAIATAVDGGELLQSGVDEVRSDHWHNGRIVLIGDAAHATGPVWAQGGAMALEDALVLSKLLAHAPHEAWAGVGADFERIRRPRVEHVRSATEKMSTLAAMPGFVRDLIAPVLGPRNYREAYGPLRKSLGP